MTDDQIDITVRLRNAIQAARESRTVAGGIKGIGDAADVAKRKAAALGPAIDRATSMADRGMSRLARSSRYPLLALSTGSTLATKWGIDYNASIESSKIALGTLLGSQKEGNREVKRAQKIARDSALLNFRDTARAEQQLIGMGVSADRTRRLLHGTSDALVALGKDPAAFQQAIDAFSQIQSKGKLMGDEITQQLGEIFPAAQILRKELGLTGDQIADLGSQDISASKGLDALAAGLEKRFGGAAKNAQNSWSAQMARMEDNTNQMLGALSKPVFDWGEKVVLPTANRAASALTKVFDDRTLAPQEKLRRAREIIDREFGPIADDIKDAISDAHIPEHLGQVMGKALPFMANAAADAAPEVAEAFADAWLNSSPWAQLLSAIYLGGKLRKFGRAAGLGGSGGGLGGVLGAGKPIPVFVTNPGFSAPGSPGSPSRNRGGSPLLNLGKKALPFAAPLAAEYALTSFLNSQPTQRPLFDQLSARDRRDIQTADRFNIGRGANGGGGGQYVYGRAVQRNGLFGQVRDAANHTPSLINQIATQVTLKADGKTLATTIAKSQAKSKARAGG